MAIETTLCYIERNEAYLMLHRISKKCDVNLGKWIGVGGKFERDESPEECMKREVLEETGLEALRWRYRGIVTFVSQRSETEYMHLFTIDGWKGNLRSCDEGKLEWVEKKRIFDLPHWKGDEIFLTLIADEGQPFFSLKLVYDGNDKLIDAFLDGERVDLAKWE
jgi:8-oxo-dGTP diphosphatase